MRLLNGQKKKKKKTQTKGTLSGSKEEDCCNDSYDHSSSSFVKRHAVVLAFLGLVVGYSMQTEEVSVNRTLSNLSSPSSSHPTTIKQKLKKWIASYTKQQITIASIDDGGVVLLPKNVESIVQDYSQNHIIVHLRTNRDLESNFDSSCPYPYLSATTRWKNQNHKQNNSELYLKNITSRGEEDYNDDEASISITNWTRYDNHTLIVRYDHNNQQSPWDDSSSLWVERFSCNMKLAHIVQELQAMTTTKFFVYDNEKIKRSDVRNLTKAQGRGTWSVRWGQRNKDFALNEVILLETLEAHPTLRTYNISEASFVVIPIPVTGLMYFSTGEEATKTLEALYEEPYFQTHPHKHVLISLSEHHFHLRHVKHMMGSGWNFEHYSRFRNVTVVQEYDAHSWYTIEKAGTALKDYGWQMAMGRPEPPLSNFGWSYSFAGAASNPKYAIDYITWDKFQHHKPIHYFYHSRKEPSSNNSTQFRHAPIQGPQVWQAFHQPSSIGFDLPYEQWLDDFIHSKFCLTIRGDNPQSRGFWRSIRAGCIPILISDMWPYYAPAFRSILNMEDYAIVVKESDFLADPVGSVHRATNLTTEQLHDKVESLALAQRIFITHHPKPLFVQAFIKETIAAMKDSYQEYKDETYGEFATALQEQTKMMEKF